MTKRLANASFVTSIIGIDPGLDGGVALIARDGVSVFDTPTIQVKKSKREYAIPEMVRLLRDSDPARVIIEAVHSMPRQGVTSSFNFGKGYGLWLGITAALGYPYDLVTPQRWKSVMLDGMAKDKGASRVRAMQLFPLVSDRLARVKDEGRAEALLIAEYGRRLAVFQ